MNRNRNRYIDTISHINLFGDFKKEELDKLYCSSKFEIKEYGKEQIIHLQNEVCNKIDIIINGKLSVQNIDENGNVLTIHVFSNMDILGANLIFASKSNYPMRVIASSTTTVLHLQRELILELCQTNLCFMSSFMKHISDRSIILADKINSISFKTIRQCIIEFLKYEYHLQKCRTIQLNITKKDLAERLGIQRTSLSRELNKMRKDGLLEYDARTITIKSVELK